MTSSADSSSECASSAFRARLWRWARRVWWLWIYLALMPVGLILDCRSHRAGPHRWTAWVLMVVSNRLRSEPFIQEHGLPRDHAELVRVFESQGWVQEDGLLDLVVEGRFVDGWGHPLIYRRDPAAPHGYYLYSKGRNRTDERGAGDDIGSGPAEPMTRTTGQGESASALKRLRWTMLLTVLLTTCLSVLIMVAIVKAAWRAWTTS